VKHNIGTGHQILLNNASILSRISRCMYQLIGETKEMKLHANKAEEDQRTHGEERCSRRPKELIRRGWRSKLMPRIE